MFTFIDVFAGIGGFRRGCELAGGLCVWACEKDKFARQTYASNFDIDDPEFAHDFAKDIEDVDPKDIPDHDLLLAGFPCQPFSTAGRREGFAHETQGTLFFELAKIIKEKQPTFFLLESVKGLLSHKSGSTMFTIMRVLNELGYWVYPKVIDADGFVPQHRERVYLAGVQADVGSYWHDLRGPWAEFEEDKFRKPPKGYVQLRHILEPHDQVPVKYTMSDRYMAGLLDHTIKQADMGNTFGYRIFRPGEVACTLTASYARSAQSILIHQGEHRNPRKLTPRECARLMGYPEHFNIPVSNTQAYKQFGNSVVPGVIWAIMHAMLPWHYRE
ncbi:DNA (cytosine-5-)-methyltransferase [Thiolapillus sp.]|uniref:DNA (cytosine-5-)-methyltransferase n=1 Tax=Thiolapillus sp. TaxID=2017437 RepID=UPI003AF5BD0D